MARRWRESACSALCRRRSSSPRSRPAPGRCSATWRSCWSPNTAIAARARLALVCRRGFAGVGLWCLLYLIAGPPGWTSPCDCSSTCACWPRSPWSGLAADRRRHARAGRHRLAVRRGCRFHVGLTAMSAAIGPVLAAAGGASAALPLVAMLLAAALSAAGGAAAPRGRRRRRARPRSAWRSPPARPARPSWRHTSCSKAAAGPVAARRLRRPDGWRWLFLAAGLWKARRIVPPRRCRRALGAAGAALVPLRRALLRSGSPSAISTATSPTLRRRSCSRRRLCRRPNASPTPKRRRCTGGRAVSLLLAGAGVAWPCCRCTWPSAPALDDRLARCCPRPCRRWRRRFAAIRCSAGSPPRRRARGRSVRVAHRSDDRRRRPARHDAGVQRAAARLRHAGARLRLCRLATGAARRTAGRGWPWKRRRRSSPCSLLAMLVRHAMHGGRDRRRRRRRLPSRRSTR